MEWIQSTFVYLLLLSVTIHLSMSDWIISNEKVPNHSEYQDAIDAFIEENKDNEFFVSREIDTIEIHSGKDSPCQWITKQRLANELMAHLMVEKPYSMRNGLVSRIIVQHERYEQKIRTTRCLNLNEQRCGGDIGLEKLNMTTQCELRYEPMPFYNYDVKKNKIKYTYANVPVCCICGVINN